MANPGGGVGAKFVSVNLNKSYGQSSHLNNGSYGPASRGRTGGGGGGMVVLSRSRTLQKAGPKLSVPPPLNLPSLRKEHERFDLSGSAGGPAGGSRPGSGQRPTSSGVGWTKPVVISSQGKDGTGGDNQVEQHGHGVDRIENRAGAYLPPSSRNVGSTGGVSSAFSGRNIPAPAETAMVLRGEDFPSLQAAVPVSSGVGMKQKDNVNQKAKHVIPEDSADHQSSGFQVRSAVNMRPQEQSSSITSGNGTIERGEGCGLGSLDLAQSRKQDQYFPGPLPMFQLSPRSDWAEDERDTSHGFADRDRDLGSSKSENYWDRDFDIPRPSILPVKPAPDRWVRDNESVRKISSDVSRLDSYRVDARTPSREGREGNMWRSSPIHKDGLNTQEAPTDRPANAAKVNVLNKDFGKESKQSPPHSGDFCQGGVFLGNQEAMFKARNNVLDGRPPWNHLKDSFNSGAEPSVRDRYVKEQSSKYKGDSLQSNSMSKSYFVSGGKMSNGIDSSWVSGREKGIGSKSGRSYLEDPFDGFTAFDEKDPFSGNLVGVIKRKKDLNKQTEFVDPVRESFEAELERVQKMQELERQRVIEEQERALEQARRQEEERQRLIREEEERRRRLEEEAKEAAWRVEQEQQAAIRRAEEQRIAREEEKRRILMEEERTKQAARQKLLELEARMAKRQAEAGKMEASVASNVDERLSAAVKINSVYASADAETWEDRERMVERIKTSPSFDPSLSNRPLDISSRSVSALENPSSILDKGKPFHSWQRGAFNNGSSSSWQMQDQKSSLLNPRRDSFDNGRAIPRKELYGGAGYMSSRLHPRGFMQEPYTDEFGNVKDQRWNFPTESDPYSQNRDMDMEFQDNVVEKYADGGWGQNRFRGNSQPFLEQQYLTSDADEPFPYGRSRYSVKQPRVFPPPSIAPTQRTSFRASDGNSAHLEFLHSNEQFNSAGRREDTTETGYHTAHQDDLEQSGLVDIQRENTSTGDQELLKDTLRCDSQSSVSVSSPPNSPPHLSHDELDESGDSPISTAAEIKQIPMSGNSSIVYNDNSGQRIDMTASSCISAVDDDEWTVENNDVQQQDEYDEDGDGYEEEDEAREGDEENLDLNQDFEDLELEEKGGTYVVNNLVLGFDEGVEVEIPNDDFERDVNNQETAFPVSNSMHVAREVEGIEGVLDDEQSYEQLDGSLQETVVQESEKSIEDSAVQVLNDSLIALTTDDTALAAKQAISSSVEVPFSTGPTTLLTTSSAHGQVDNPVKVQFGLFSGPSLIPSPVPAIQIGSIQMPLHLHPPVGTSLSHLQPSQQPIFQFGSIFQGVIPLPPQSLSFVQPNIKPFFSQNTEPNQTTQDSTRVAIKDHVSSLVVNEQPAFVSRHSDHPYGLPLESRSVSVQGSAHNNGRTQITSDHVSSVAEGKLTSVSIAQAEVGSQNDRVTDHQVSLSGSVPDSQLQATQTAGDFACNDKNFGGFKTHGHFSISKGKRFAYAVRNPNLRSSFQGSDLPGSDANGFNRRRRTVQRTEFRVRENVERRLPASSSSHNSHPDDKFYNGKSSVAFVKSGPKRVTAPSKPSKAMAVSESSFSGHSGFHEIDSANCVGKQSVKDVVIRGQNLSDHGEGNLKRNTREEDFDAPLQSGVVRVFKQPGIEAPSDEDDFIEVRSKRQMLNDRREQREKEIKAKSRAAKLPRKTRAGRSGFVKLGYSKKVSGSLEGEFSQNVRSQLRSSEGRGLGNKETSATLVSQPLAPIGTPAVKSEIPFDKKYQIKPLQSSSISVVSGVAKELGPIVKFEDKNKAMEGLPLPLNSWDPVRSNQQVMALTQTQLEEAMKPSLCEAQITSIGSHSSATSEPLLPSSSLLLKDRSFSSAASPINSLLAGEKIQFGAVTSPTILPPSDQVPGSSRPDVHISHNLSVDEDDCSIFFEKEKPSDVSYIHLQDPEAEAEAEAEAAASAVAVAAISNDDVVGNGLGSVALSDAKIFGGVDIGAVTAGMHGDQKLASQSQTEERHSVSLPADLSVDETPPISLWPPLPSPQSSSGQPLSHFLGGRPSNFPFYEMNTMLGGHIFTFGPQEESAGSQSQPEKSSTPTTAPLGSWPQCPSTVDSFYGPPAGFGGPFISHPGGIPGVQGPPHMVVYNHFAPVAQFGQMGLSFMGPTFIPSGKPLDWKHNAPSPAIGLSGDRLNNANVGSVQHNPPNISPPTQHLAQGSPMVPMPSALAMFDILPFQAQSDMPIQAHWSQGPTSPLRAIPLSHSLQQQGEGLVPSQFGLVHPSDQSMNISRFSEPQTSTPSESGPSFNVTTEVNTRKLPDELSLLDSSKSTVRPSAQSSIMSQSSSASVGAGAGKADSIRNGGSSNSEGHGGLRTRALQQKNSFSHHGHSGNYNDQRGVGTFPRNNAGNDWSSRRPSFHGRNQSFGAEKGFSNPKVKQVYVAKQTTSGTSTT